MKREIIILLLLSLLILNHCELFHEDDPPYSGITKTTLVKDEEWDETIPQIISEDEEDWLIEYSPSLPEDYLDPQYRVGPAFPNPATDSTYIKLILPQTDSVYIYIKNEDGDIVKTIVNKTMACGYRRLYWVFDENIDSGMYRCYYRIGSDETDYIKTGYGDIKVKK